MKKILTVIFILIFSTSAYANKNKNTWDYPLTVYEGWVVKGSADHYKFKSDLREDKNVLKEFKKNKDGLILINGEKNLRDLYKYFDHDLPSGEASTISGHILELAKRIPLYGETVNDEYFIYKILSHSRKQISKIEITPIK